MSLKPENEFLDRRYETNLPFRPTLGPALRASGAQKHETFLNDVSSQDREYETNLIVLGRFASTASRDHFAEQRVRDKSGEADSASREYETNRPMDSAHPARNHPNGPISQK